MAAASPDPLVARFAQRVATRDDPAPYVPPRQDREAILERLDAALRLLGVRLRNRRHTLARLCLALAPQPRATAVQLAAELEITRQTVTQAMSRLLAPGLLAYEPEGRHRYYRFTRAGEDWLLPLLTGEAGRSSASSLKPIGSSSIGRSWNVRSRSQTGSGFLFTINAYVYSLFYPNNQAYGAY